MVSVLPPNHPMHATKNSIKKGRAQKGFGIYKMMFTQFLGVIYKCLLIGLYLTFEVQLLGVLL